MLTVRGSQGCHTEVTAPPSMHSGGPGCVHGTAHTSGVSFLSSLGWGVVLCQPHGPDGMRHWDQILATQTVCSTQKKTAPEKQVQLLLSSFTQPAVD